MGYVDGSVDLAERKTDEWVREISKRVESGEIGSQKHKEREKEK